MDTGRAACRITITKESVNPREVSYPYVEVEGFQHHMHADILRPLAQAVESEVDEVRQLQVTTIA